MPRPESKRLKGLDQPKQNSKEPAYSVLTHDDRQQRLESLGIFIRHARGLRPVSRARGGTSLAIQASTRG
jgi:hypothetical protein